MKKDITKAPHQMTKADIEHELKNARGTRKALLNRELLKRK